MREILFRGKTEDGRWVYGDARHNYDGVPIGISDCCGGNPVIPETIGQYTGLTANGKKIFEGDILKATDEKARTYIYKVVFINGIFGLVIKHGGYACPVVHWANNCIEVIGNIHDNPELLKGEQ